MARVAPALGKKKAAKGDQTKRMPAWLHIQGKQLLISVGDALGELGEVQLDCKSREQLAHNANVLCNAITKRALAFYWPEAPISNLPLPSAQLGGSIARTSVQVPRGGRYLAVLSGTLWLEWHETPLCASLGLLLRAPLRCSPASDALVERAEALLLQHYRLKPEQADRLQAKAPAALAAQLRKHLPAEQAELLGRLIGGQHKRVLLEPIDLREADAAVELALVRSALPPQTGRRVISRHYQFGGEPAAATQAHCAVGGCCSVGCSALLELQPSDHLSVQARLLRVPIGADFDAELRDRFDRRLPAELEGLDLEALLLCYFFQGLSLQAELRLALVEQP